MSPCFPRQSGLLVALAAGAWNSKVRSLRACRSCDGLCYMPSISICLLYTSFRTPLIFSATIVIILMTCVLMLAVNASERILLGPPGDDEDPDADQ